jgi:hypothetical protein
VSREVLSVPKYSKWARPGTDVIKLFTAVNYEFL